MMKPRLKWVVVGSALALSITAAVGLAVMTVQPARPDASDPRLVSLGQKVYADYCASCHGVNLEGQPDWRTRDEDGRLPAPPHDDTGHTWHHPDEQLVGIVRDGLEPYAPEGYQSDMPGFGDVLTREEILAVIAYIKSTWPDEIQARQAGRSAQ
ncbi:c-type cytochrome [Caenispirillum salinarum]|uniref:c-type cytochrome n=1 Tax=Caenispirillum salinarum TaxID=859058 RepID=UPI0038508B49